MKLYNYIIYKLWRVQLIKKTKSFRKKRRSTKKHKGGLGRSLYGGELDIKNEGLKEALNKIPRFNMSVKNFLSTALTKAWGYGSIILGKLDGSGYLALMAASWSDSKARQKILDKLNAARIGGNEINFPHIWKNVSVDNKLIRDPSDLFETPTHFLFNPMERKVFYYHPNTSGYNYECDKKYTIWHSDKNNRKELAFKKKFTFMGNNVEVQEFGCDEIDNSYQTRDRWLQNNDLGNLSFDEMKLKKESITITKEDNAQIQRNVNEAAINVERIQNLVKTSPPTVTDAEAESELGSTPGPRPGAEPGSGPRPESEPGAEPGAEPISTGGKHKSRRVTKHKRK
jgi:hypothetical protein